MKSNLEIYDLFRVVPETAKKEIKGGRMNGKTDINPMWRIKALTEQFGPCGIGWYYKIVNKWLERYESEIAAFVDIEMYIKIDNEWSMPISGTGGSMFVAKEKSGPYVSDECYKMATTDAISVACKQLGIGADVYWQADKTKYDKSTLKEPEIITANEAVVLKNLCINKGLDVTKVFKVPVEQLTKQQYVEAIKNLEKIKK
ncbi:MAG: hypothetical protein K0S47_3164 [Herbinix sp.]|jgi:hypothetical protein|nr:hypothetical protein [Herbinix sp.]